MRRIPLFLAAALITLTVTGCSYFTDFVEGTASDRIAEAAEKYCEEPAESRERLREAVNAGWDGQIAITCPEDAPAQ